MRLTSTGGAFAYCRSWAWLGQSSEFNLTDDRSAGTSLKIRVRFNDPLHTFASDVRRDFVVAVELTKRHVVTSGLQPGRNSPPTAIDRKYVIIQTMRDV